MLPPNLLKEALCRAYVRAVAARAGVLYLDSLLDFGIDVHLREVEEDGGHHRGTGPQIDLQLKSTTRANTREEGVRYDLDVPAYNLLRRRSPERARWLVVLVLPEEEEQWLRQSAEELALRRCAYWLSLEGEGPTPN